MRVFSARVHNGAIVPDPEIDLPEGMTVTVVASDDDEGFEASPEEEERLLASMREADQGDVITAEELLNRLSR